MIAQVEDAILQAVEETLPNLLREAKTLGGAWTMDALKRALQFSPAVYVSFLGGSIENWEPTRVEAQFGIYVVTKSGLEQSRRTGEKRTIGGYEIVERLIPVLDGLVIEGHGSFALKKVGNLFSEAAIKLGGTVYALTGTVPIVYEAPAPIDLGEFLTFHSDMDAAMTSETYVRAEAQLVLAGGKITDVTITQAGAGYTQPPQIKLYGPGSGAVLQAVIVGGMVTGVTITDGGAGYTEQSRIAITYPPGGEMDAEDEITLDGSQG